MTQIAVNHHGVDGGDDKLVKKLLKSWKIVKSWKISRIWKVAKVVGSEEPSFLTSKIRLAFIRISFNHIHNRELLAIGEIFKNWGPYNCKLEILIFINYTSNNLEIQKTQAPVRFARFNNSFNTTFVLIIDKQS